MWTKKTFRRIIYILAILFCSFALSPIYLQQALLHWYANIDDYKIFINDTISTGNYDEWEIDRNYNVYTLPNKAKQYIEETKTVAFLVIRDEKILFEKYWDDYGYNSYSNMFSVTKSIVSLLLGIAIDEGYIRTIDEPIGKYIPEFANDNRGKITIENLLTMSSGLNWYETYSHPFSITTKAYYGTKLRDITTSQKLESNPGTIYDYQSGTTQLLGFVVEKATGYSLNEYAAEKLWKPVGAKHPALWSIDKKGGDERAFCCIFTNARDIARIGQLILNKGVWKGKQIVSKAYLEKAIQPATYLTDIKTNKPCDFYGYQWWILNYENYKIPSMRGHRGQYIFAIPEKNAVIVRLGKERDKQKEVGVKKFFEIGLKMLK